MGYKQFMIIIDSPTGSYYAGSNITGRVLLSLDKPKKVRGVRIKFEGAASVSWTESERVRKDNGETTNENVTYSAEESFFSIKYFLVGSESAEVTIPPGENVYPFSTTLPPRLPTSFEGEHGYVRYSIKATLDRPWKMDEETQIVYTVVTPVDLNYFPNVKEPVKKEVHKNFCCLCCKSGPLSLVGVIPFSGFVPGQNIPVTIEIDNASNQDITTVKCRLMKELKWIAKSPKCKERLDKIKLVKEEMVEGVPKSSSKSWSKEIKFPLMPFINLDDCNIIKVRFYLEIEASPSGLHTALTLEFPLTLGAVPLRDYSAVSSPSLPENNQGFDSSPNVYPTIPLLPTAPSEIDPPSMKDEANIGFNISPSVPS